MTIDAFGDLSRKPDNAELTGGSIVRCLGRVGVFLMHRQLLIDELVLKHESC